MVIFSDPVAVQKRSASFEFREGIGEAFTIAELVSGHPDI
jgi:hypothetical protein